jgi:hypothetical protein
VFPFSSALASCKSILSISRLSVFTRQPAYLSHSALAESIVKGYSIKVLGENEDVTCTFQLSETKFKLLERY